MIGKRADRVAEADAWSFVAGLTVGQDVSDRALQFAAGGQFSLGKSRRGFGPMGPWVVTIDELDDPDDLGLGCSVDGETMQKARTNDLVFSVPRHRRAVERALSLPGDVIFTGRPRVWAPLASRRGFCGPARSSNRGSTASARSAIAASDPLRCRPEVSGHLVGSTAFKAAGTGAPRPAGSIPVHLRQIRR